MELLRTTAEEGAKTQDASKRAGVISSFASGLKVALLLGTVLVASDAGTYLYFRNRVSTDDAQVDGHNAPIAPKVSGSISQVLVEDNEAVKAGQVLVRIDPRDYQAKVDQARAALAVAGWESEGAHAGILLADKTTASAVFAAESQLDAALADDEGAKADYERASTSELAYALADVESKRATRDRANADLARMKPLVAKGDISELQFDFFAEAALVGESNLRASAENLIIAQKKATSSKLSMLASAARVKTARALLEQARANRRQVDITSAQASSAEVAILQARADLEAAELQLSYTTIVAPIDGLATRKTFQLGQIVQPGQTLLMIVPLQQVWVTANFKETKLANVRPGQRAEVNVGMYGRSFEGQVNSIAGASGATLSLLPPTGDHVKVVRRIPVKIVLKQLPSGFVLRPGTSVHATIFTE